MIKKSGLAVEMRFLREIAVAVVDASRVHPGEAVGESEPNLTGGTLIRPGGRNCYPAFWIRDFAMSLESGLVRPGEVEHALLLTARRQAPEDWHTPTGSFVPGGSIADHITFDGKPIFFPGTNDFETQGQPWGYYPSLDNPFFFIEMAWHLAVTEGREDILLKEINGITLMERMDLAFSVPPVKGDTGLVWCDDKKRGVSFGFTDSVAHTGYLLFCSLLRYRAAHRMAVLHENLGNKRAARQYRRIANVISERLPRVFSHDSGLLRASTGRSEQPDVWGSAFAVYSGALKGTDADSVSRALLRAYFNRTIAWKGNIRHVPTDSDFSESTAWERVLGKSLKNRYQNGAYWNTPTGWVCFAISGVEESAARELALDYINELRAGDFRKGEDYGSPFECMHPEGDYHQNPVYMTSVTCPLGAFHRLG